MPSTQSAILLLNKQFHTVCTLSGLLRHSDYSIVSLTSEEQALAHIQQKPPFLIIVAGDTQQWSEPWLKALRHAATIHRIALIALTDFHRPRWMYQEDPGFDGFLVYPLSREVLLSLVQSAQARQALCLAV